MATVLVAETDPETRFRIEESTRGSDFDCLLAATFDEAIRLGTRPFGTIDILLTSLMLIPYHGGSLANRLKSYHPGMKVVFMSGMDPRLLNASGIRVSGTHLLATPFTGPVLLDTLERVRRRGKPWVELVSLAA